MSWPRAVPFPAETCPPEDEGLEILLLLLVAVALAGDDLVLPLGRVAFGFAGMVKAACGDGRLNAPLEADVPLEMAAPLDVAAPLEVAVRLPLAEERAAPRFSGAAAMPFLSLAVW